MILAMIKYKLMQILNRNKTFLTKYSIFQLKKALNISKNPKNDKKTMKKTLKK